MVEGFGRFWPKEFAHKMRIAIGELKETQDHLARACEDKYISTEAFDEMSTLANRSIGASVKFVEYLETSGDDWKKGYQAARRKPPKGNGRPAPAKTGRDDPGSERTEN